MFFDYDPDADEWFRVRTEGLYRTAAAGEDALFAGTYPQGRLVEWDPDAKWNLSEGTGQDLGSNPRDLTGPSTPAVGRPYDLLVHPGGRHVVLAGMPDYGNTGGGLVFWDRHEETAAVLPHDEVVRWHSTASLAALPGGDLLGGTTVEPAMGGERKAEVAGLYRLDPDDREVTWSATPWERGERVMDLTTTTPEGTVLGILDRDRLSAFDPGERRVLDEVALDHETASAQAPEDFVWIPDGRLFLLFADGTIAGVDPEPREVIPRAESPAAIDNGGACRDGRLYSTTEERLFSWKIPPADGPS